MGKTRKMAAKTYTIASEQMVGRPLDEVFAFFARAQNLEILTPPWLNFRILAVAPEPIRKGTVIDYSLRIHGIPLRWTSEIVEWEPPNRFVDLQLRGPYKLWRHEHRFARRDGETLISDTVELALPLGLLGQIAYRIKVRSDVQQIFAFRENAIKALFA